MASHFPPFHGTVMLSCLRQKTNGAACLFGRPRVPHYLVTPPSHPRQHYIRRGGSEDGTVVLFAQRRRPAKTKQEMKTRAKAGPAWGRAHSKRAPGPEEVPPGPARQPVGPPPFHCRPGPRGSKRAGPGRERSCRGAVSSGESRPADGSLPPPPDSRPLARLECVNKGARERARCPRPSRLHLGSQPRSPPPPSARVNSFTSAEAAPPGILRCHGRWVQAGRGQAGPERTGGGAGGRTSVELQS